MSDIRHIFEQDLRGKDYIRARGLTPKIVKEQQHICESCRQQEQLPRVLTLLENWKPTCADS